MEVTLARHVFDDRHEQLLLLLLVVVTDYTSGFVSDIAIFMLKRDVKLQLTN